MRVLVAWATRSRFLIANLAFRQSDAFPSFQYSRLGAQPVIPHRLEEVDLQFERGERLSFFELARPGHAHRAICEITQNSAVQRSHRIGVTAGDRFHFECRFARRDLDDAEADRLSDGQGRMVTGNDFASELNERAFLLHREAAY